MATAPTRTSQAEIEGRGGTSVSKGRREWRWNGERRGLTSVESLPKQGVAQAERDDALPDLVDDVDALHQGRKVYGRREIDLELGARALGRPVERGRKVKEGREKDVRPPRVEEVVNGLQR